MAMRNYDADKGLCSTSFAPKAHRIPCRFRTQNSLFVSESFKNFFIDFCQTDDEGHKHFKYAEQLTRVAHREQVNNLLFL